MKPLKVRRARTSFFHIAAAAFCAGAIAVGAPTLRGQQPAAQPQTQTETSTVAPAAAEPAPKIPNDQLDSLVAPIALYPDPLLSQVLAAST